MLIQALMKARRIKDAATDLYYAGVFTPDEVLSDLYHGIEAVIEDKRYQPIQAELKAVKDIVVVEMLDAYFSHREHVRRFRRWKQTIGF